MDYFHEDFQYRFEVVQVIQSLLDGSHYFEVAPLPYDKWRITVKNEPNPFRILRNAKDISEGLK